MFKRRRDLLPSAHLQEESSQRAQTSLEFFNQPTRNRTHLADYFTNLYTTEGDVPLLWCRLGGVEIKFVLTGYWQSEIVGKS